MATLTLPFPNFVNGTNTDAEQVDANNAAVKSFVESELAHLDGSKDFSGYPKLPTAAPSDPRHPVRKQDLDALGLTLCTSTTRPSSPVLYQRIRETDLGRDLFWNGSKWVVEQHWGPWVTAPIVVMQAVNISMGAGSYWRYKVEGSTFTGQYVAVPSSEGTDGQPVEISLPSGWPLATGNCYHGTGIIFTTPVGGSAQNFMHWNRPTGATTTFRPQTNLGAWFTTRISFGSVLIGDVVAEIA